MALVSIKSTVKEEPKREYGTVIKKKGVYKYIDTDIVGVKKVVSKQGGYLVFLDYGRKLKLDKKTGKMVYRQDKTDKHVKTEAEAIQLRLEADAIRKGLDIQTQKPKKVTMGQVIKEFKKSVFYTNLNEGYQQNYNNYINHILDYFNDLEPFKITTLDIEDYYRFQKECGNKCPGKEEGISINSISKHKTALKNIWEFMLQSGKYNVHKNVVLDSKVPKDEVEINGIYVKVSKIPFNARPLTLDELNYTLNDIVQNEYDRSLLLLVALSSIGSLRTAEVIALKVGKVYHNDLMSVSDDSFEYSGYDKEYYEENDNLMMIDEAIRKIKGKYVRKLPKGDRIRVSCIPNCLKEIIEYTMEQRMELLNVLGRPLKSDVQLYLPIVNVIKNEVVYYPKLNKKWKEYQTRRNKRMEAAGLEPIPVIRFHDLRHTHANLLKIDVPAWEISCNMGHLIPDANTTKKVYWHDRQPFRQHIIDYFDKNIKIDWDKALKKSVNDKNNIMFIDRNGHLVAGEDVFKKIKKLRKKKSLSMEEYADLMFLEKEALDRDIIID